MKVDRACRVSGLHRSLWYYRSRKDDSAVMYKLQSLAERYPQGALMIITVRSDWRASSGTASGSYVFTDLVNGRRVRINVMDDCSRER